MHGQDLYLMSLDIEPKVGFKEGLKLTKFKLNIERDLTLLILGDETGEKTRPDMRSRGGGVRTALLMEGAAVLGVGSEGAGEVVLSYS